MDDAQWTVSDVAAWVGVAAATIRGYASRRTMPPPDGRLGRTPWWWQSTIVEWRPRRPYDAGT